MILIFRLGAEDVAAADDARDVFGLIAVGGNASEGEVAFLLE